MKKRTMTLCALLALVTITSYAVSGTYAKYTYEFSTSDSARVAKWGVNKSFSINLFKSSYIDETNDAKDVESKNTTDKVVAPGTEGYYEFNLDLTGNVPETNYKIMISNITAETTTDDGTTIEPTKDNIKDAAGNAKMTYYLKEVTTPIAANTKFKDVGFTKADGTVADGVESTNDIDQLVTLIKNKYDNRVYGANEVDSKKWVIGWKWNFDVSEAENITDTTLGNGGKEKLGDSETVADADLARVILSLNVRIEQTEEAAK